MLGPVVLAEHCQSTYCVYGTGALKLGWGTRTLPPNLRASLLPRTPSFATCAPWARVIISTGKVFRPGGGSLADHMRTPVADLRHPYRVGFSTG